MALQKQHIPIMMNQGIDTHTDPKAIPAGKLAVLQNGLFNKDNRINKRFGADSLSALDIDGSTLSNGQGLFNFDNELCAIANNKAYSRDTVASKWIPKGSVISVTSDFEEVYKGPSSVECGATIYQNGYYIYMIEQDTSEYFMLIEDVSTNAIVKKVAAPVNFRESGDFFVLGGTLYYFYKSPSAAALNYVSINLTTLAFGTPATLTTSTTPTAGTDARVTVVGSDLYVAYFSLSGTSQFNVVKFNSSFVQTAINTDAFVASDCAEVAIAPLSGGGGVVAVGGNTADGYAMAYNTSLVEQAPAFFLAYQRADAANALQKVYIISTSSTTWTVYASFANTSDQRLPYINRKTVTFATNTVVFDSQIGKRLRIASAPFVYAGKTYITAYFRSPTQPCYFWIDEEGNYVSKALYGRAPYNSASSAFPETWSYQEISDGVFRGPVLVADDTKDEARGGRGSNTGKHVGRVDLNFKTSSGVYDSLSDQIGLNSHLSGGIIQAYDGYRLSELNFNQFPEVSSAPGSTTGGTLAAGSYLVYAVWVWYDNKGQKHVSAPSAPSTVTTTGATSSIVLNLYTLQATNKRNADYPVFVDVYITEPNGSIPYSIFSGTLQELDFTQDLTAVSITAVTTTNRILYTQGGVLDNYPPPSASSMCIYKNRLFVFDTEDGDVYFSKEWRQSEGIAFAFGFTIPMDRKNGKSVAGIQLDDKLIIFKRNRILVTAGEGPVDTGAQYDYLRPQELPTNVGCTEAESVLLIPNGVMFKGEKGFYLLGRDLAVSYIGKEVEQFNNLVITGATKKEDENYAIFTTNDSSIALMYNWENGQWGTFTNYAGEDIILWQGKLARIGSDGVVKVETEAFTDDDDFIKLRIVTGWITLQGILAYYRIYQVIILGVYYSEHELRVGMGYDYEPDFTDYNEYDSTAIIGPEVLPVPYYGAGVYEGDAEKSFAIRYQNSRQKNTAFRVAIEDMEPADPADFGEGFSMTGLGLQVGVKKGSYRVSAAKSMGKI